MMVIITAATYCIGIVLNAIQGMFLRTVSLSLLNSVEVAPVITITLILERRNQRLLVVK